MEEILKDLEDAIREEAERDSQESEHVINVSPEISNFIKTLP